MGIFQKLTTKADFWPIVIVLIFSVLAARSLLFQPGYFNMHDDLQMMRQLEMEKCFFDGQIPCRWVPDMGYGFGFPLFNFYPPLPYLIGELLRLIGLSFVTVVKLTFSLSFIVSGVGMYLLGKEFWGRLGGVVSSIFYVWAPYHSVDVYVRGAMNEAWALVFFPLILWTSYRLIINKKDEIRWTVYLALSWFGLFTSHNLMVLIFTPVFAIWCLLFLWREKKWKRIPYLAISGILALGLSAFFTIPAVLEQRYVQVNTLVTGYYEYIAHFASINQLLISRFWGYGPSIWGDNDGMPFQIGHVHWILSLIVGLLVIYQFVRKREKANYNTVLIVLFFLVVGWFAAFMAHSRSTPIWQAIGMLSFVQFPWRFLTLVTLSFSFISGSLVLLLRNWKFGSWISGLSVLILLILNWNYFKPDRIGPLTDNEKFTGAAWELQQTAGIYDYLPNDAIEAPKESRKYVGEILEGEGAITDEKFGTNWASFNTKVESHEATVRIGIFKFPIWKVSVDGKDIETYVPEEEKWGRMWIDIPKGEHKVYAKLHNTPARSITNIVSLVTWVGLLSFPVWKKRFFSS